MKVRKKSSVLILTSNYSKLIENVVESFFSEIEITFIIANIARTGK